MSTEAKVGLLFFIGVGVLLWFTVFVADFGGAEGEYRVVFPRVTGLRTGATVTYNGVPVGQVSAIEPELIQGRPMVEIWFDVQEEFRDRMLIDEETTMRIEQGLLGEATLVILGNGGGVPISQPALDRLEGKPPVDFNQALGKLNDILSENEADLRRAIATLPDMLGEFAGMAKEVRTLVAENRDNATEALTAVAAMGNAVAEMVEQNQQALNEALNRIAGMAGEVEGAVAENRADVRAALATLPETARNLRAASAELERILVENRGDFRAMMQALASAGPKLDAIAGDLQRVSAQLASGEGTLGKLVFEDTLHERATTTLAQANQRLEEIEPFTSGFSDLKFYTGLWGGYNTERESGIGTAYLRIEPKPWKFYEAGATWRGAPADRDTVQEDPDDVNVDINLALGWRFFPDDEIQRYRLSIKGGILEGAVGGQADTWLWGDRLTGSLLVRDRHDDFDPNERRFEEGEGLFGRAWLELRAWRRVYLVAGADDVFDDAGPFIGLRGELLDNDVRNLATAASVIP